MWRPINEASVDFDLHYTGKQALLWTPRYGEALGRIFKTATGEVSAAASGYLGVDWEYWWDFGNGQTMPPRPEPTANVGTRETHVGTHEK